MKYCILLLLATFAFDSHAESPNTAHRNRARELEQQVYGNNWTLTRAKDRLTSEFGERSAFRGNELAVGDISLAGIELFIGTARIVFPLDKPVSVGGKIARFVRTGTGVILVLDGIARFVITLDGKDPTISPLLTYGLAQMDIASPFLKQPSWHMPGVGYDSPFNVDSPAGYLEMVFGAFLTAAPYLVLSDANRFRRPLKVLGPVILADGVLRFFGNYNSRENAIFPLYDFVVTKVREQPVQGTRTLGDVLDESIAKSVGAN